MANDFRIVISGAYLNKKAYQDIINDLNKLGKAVKIPLNIDSSSIKKSLKDLSYVVDASGNITKSVQSYNAGLGKTVQITSKLNKETQQLEVISSKVTQNQKKAHTELEKSIKDAEKRNKQFFDSFTQHANKSAQQSASAFKQSFKEIENAQKQAFEKNRQFDTWFMPQLSSKSAQDSFSVFEPITKEISKTKNQQFDSWFVPGLDKTTKSAKQSAVAFEDLFNRAEKSRKGLSGIELQIASLNPMISDGSKKTLSFGDAIGIAVERTMQWATAMTLFYGSLRTLQSGIGYIVQMDTAITDLSKVVDFSTSELQEMSKQAIILGNELGKSSVEIMKGMAEFGRITKSKDEIIELTRVATMASNVTTMTADMAAKALTSTMVTFGLEAKDAMMVLDSWNELQNNFRVSAEDLADAIGKVGAASKIAKTDMQTLEGQITAIIQATGISGAEAGTAVKSFISRMFRTEGSDSEELGKTAEALKKIANIDLESNGKLMGFGEILNSIAIKWKDMREQQKLALAQQIGSTYHYSKFIALMDNYQISLDATNKAYNSQNSALDENAKKMESVSGRIGKFTVALEEMWSKTIESSTIKTIVDLGTAIVQLVDKIGLLGSVVITANIALLAFGKMNKLNDVILSVINSVSKLTLSTITLTSVLSALWPLLAVGAIVGAVKLFDALTASIDEQKQIVSTLSDEYEKLKSEIDKFQNLENINSDQKEYLSLLERELALKEKILATEKQRLARKDVLGQGVIGGGITEDVTEDINQISILERRRKSIEKRLSTINEEDNPKLFQNLVGQLKRVNDEANKVELSLIENKKAVDEYIKSVGDSDPKLAKDLQEISDKIEKSIPQVRALNDGIKENTEVKKENATTTTQYNSSIENFNKQIEESGKNIDFLNKSLEELDDNHQLSGKTISELIDKYPELVNYLNDEKELSEQLKKKISEETDSFRQSVAEKLKLSSEFINGVTSKYPALLQGLVDAYGQDVTNFKSFLDIKESANTALIAKLGTAWAGFYGDQARTIDDVLKDVEFVDSGLFGPVASSQQAMEAVRPLLNLKKTLDKMAEDATKNISVGGGNNGSGGSTTKEPYKAVADQYLSLTNAIEKTNNVLEVNQTLLANTTDEQKKISLLQQQVKLYKQQQEQLHSLAEAFRNERESLKTSLSKEGFLFAGEGDNLMITNLDNIKDKGKEVEDQFKRFFDLQINQIPALGKQWQDYAGQIDSAKKSIEDVRQAQIDNNTKIADSIVQAIKEAYKTQEKLTLAAIDKELDALNDAHDKKMDLLDEELDRYKDIIDIKLKSLEREEDEEDYNAKLEKAQKSRQQTVNKINILKLSADTGDLEAKAQIAELNKDLDKQDEEIAEMKLERDRTLRKENLQDQLDSFKDEIDAKKKTENQNFKSTKDSLDKQKKEITDYYDDLINNERYYADLRNQIIAGQIDNVSSKLDSFLDDFKSKNRETVKELGLSWQGLLNTIDNVKTAQNSLSNVQKSSDSTSKAIDSGMFGDLSGVTGKARDQLEEALKLYGFDTGGYTGSFGKQGKLALLHEKELVLNKADTSNLLKIVDITRNLIDKINMPKFTPNVAMAGMGGVTNVYELNLNIENLNGDKKSADMIYNRMITGIKKLGGKV